MAKRYRLRTLVAPTAGFLKAGAIFLAGLVVFTLGAAFSAKVTIVPFLDRLAEFANRMLGRLLPQGQDLEEAAWVLGGALLLLGFYLIFLGGRAAFRHVLETINPGLKSGVAERFRRQQQLAQGPRIVALGGGTGLSTLLRGLKQHSSNITAIVTVTDDGGSSGRLVAEAGIIPPGDIRNCLVALADAEKAMTDLFQHRFKGDFGSLSGHSMGNLLIAALVDQARGDFEQAIEIASDVLAIRGRVVPSTLTPCRLRAVMEDGTEINGETAIVESERRIRRVYLDPGEVSAHHAALDAIAEADLICIGPGSVYTSVIPNLLVPGISEALKAANVPKAYICNVMTQHGESDSFTASEHVTAIQANVDHRCFDYVLVNTEMPSGQSLERYKGAEQYFVLPDVDRIKAMGFRVLAGNFINEADNVRHDPMRVAAKLVSLLG